MTSCSVGCGWVHMAVCLIQIVNRARISSKHLLFGIASSPCHPSKAQKASGQCCCRGIPPPIVSASSSAGLNTTEKRGRRHGGERRRGMVVNGVKGLREAIGIAPRAANYSGDMKFIRRTALLLSHTLSNEAYGGKLD
mmetsp:Transcript_2534/g.4464  ORF Transcript_2534/g.4464 Transcript_2534/m.4464 type:complete len:138 (+) Transcript_2534:110-523(+)